MRICFDLEANGLLLPQKDKSVATKIHCIVTKDIDSGEVDEWYGDKLKDGIKYLLLAHTLIGHNIIQYDIPLIKKLYDIDLSNKELVDTLVISRLLNPDRKDGHSLEAWGKRLGHKKVEHEDWTKLTWEMLHRCREDVEINHELYDHLLVDMKGWNWNEAIELENEVASIMIQQEINGVLFDTKKAQDLVSHLQNNIDKIDNSVHLPSKPKAMGATINKPFKVNGHLIKRVIDWLSDKQDLTPHISGPFTRIEWRRLNLGSEVQVKQLLLANGWKPTQWNYRNGERTSPKITEDSFDEVNKEIGHLVKQRKLLSHRQSQIQGWIDNVRDDGRLTAGANTLGTNTGRMRHRTVVNVPGTRAEYGEEMRSLFIVPEDRVLVGHDASQLELRMLAHYMNDKLYTEEILNGDIHTFNQGLAGLPTRDSAKSFIYAFIYGAGNKKLGQLVGGDSSDGAELRSRFLSNCPELERLIESVKFNSRRGWLKGLDGRRIYMRRDKRDGRVLEHKALNTLLQGAGAVVMKKSMILLDKWVRDLEIDSKKVIDMHDEAQAEVNPCDEHSYKTLSIRSVIESGEYFNLNIPLDADVRIGRDWLETH